MDAIEIIRTTRGLNAKITRELRLSRSAVSQWSQVPADRVVRVSEIIGIPPHEIRPDVFPAPPPPAQDAAQ